MLGYWQSNTNLLVWTRWTLPLPSAATCGHFPH